MIVKVFFQPLKLSPIFTIIIRFIKLQPNTMFITFGMDAHMHLIFLQHIQNMHRITYMYDSICLY